MKANRFLFTVLFLLSAAVFRLPAQQNEADRKVLSEIRAGADKEPLELYRRKARKAARRSLAIVSALVG
jgi:hypothetical protein